MMNRALLLLALMAVCVSVAFAAEAPKIGKNDKPCNRDLLKGLENCCDVPKLLSVDTAFACQKQDEEANKKRSEKEQASCLIECIMKNRTHVSGKGEFDWDLITKEFSAGQTDWLALIKDNINICKLRVNKWGKKPDTGKCDSRPSKFMSCMGRELSRNCPMKFRLDTDKKFGCDKKFAHLAECSAFAKDDEKMEKETKKTKASPKKGGKGK